jgi:hypothetical protein
MGGGLILFLAFFSLVYIIRTLLSLTHRFLWLPIIIKTYLDTVGKEREFILNNHEISVAMERHLNIYKAIIEKKNLTRKI